MDETFKRDTPGLGALKKSLDEIRTGVDKLVKEKRILEPDPSDLAGGENGEGAGVEGEAGGDGAGGSGAGGSTRSRQDALRKLAEVAEFFRRTEPHSPVSYLVQRAIRWGQMPLDEWLVDVVKNDGVLDHLRETLGLQQTSGGSSPDESS
jgi:type VI secretion system protein ImpA